MTEKTEEEILAHLRMNILPPIVYVLKVKSGALREFPPKEFKRAASILIVKIEEEFLNFTGTQKFQDFNFTFASLVHRLIASSFNSVLPLDYPYAVGVVQVKDQPTIGYTFVKRKIIPGIQECEHQDFLLVQEVESKEDIENGNHGTLRIISNPATDDEEWLLSSLNNLENEDEE